MTDNIYKFPDRSAGRFKKSDLTHDQAIDAIKKVCGVQTELAKADKLVLVFAHETKDEHLMVDFSGLNISKQDAYIALKKTLNALEGFL